MNSQWGCVLDYDADTISGADGSQPSSWTDSVSSKVASGGNAYLRLPSSGHGINGHASLWGGGSSARTGYQTSNFNVASLPNLMWCAVYRANTAASGDELLMEHGNNGTGFGAIGTLSFSFGGYFSGNFNSGGSVTPTGVISGGSAYDMNDIIDIIVFVCMSCSGGMNNFVFSVNGCPVASAGAGADNGPSTASLPINLLARNGSTTFGIRFTEVTRIMLFGRSSSFSPYTIQHHQVLAQWANARYGAILRGFWPVVSFPA
jgi:hypothetical protein